MSKDPRGIQDNTTVLVGNHDRNPSSEALTDFKAPQFEQLADRIVYSAQHTAAETLTISINPLVAIASGLLSQAVQLKRSTGCEDLPKLNADLIDELNKFLVTASYQGIEDGEATAARYILCSMLDEAVVTTSWGMNSTWSQMSLLSALHNETFGGEKFFQLLTHYSQNPLRHLHMLELMYLCLSLGFEGKYRVQLRGPVDLDGIRESVFRQIRLARGEVPRPLSPQWEGLNHRRRKAVRIVPAWTLVLITGVFLVSMYTMFSWVLGGHRDTILQAYQPLDPAFLTADESGE